MSVNVAIAGFAHGHVERYITVWKENSEMGVTVIAGWDHEAARLEAAAQRHGIAACPSLDDMLALPGL